MIPLFRPSLGEEELEAIRQAFKSGWVGLGPRTREFEEAFAEYIGVKHAVGMASATDALQLSLKTFGVEGGEVITPSMTFVSTNHAILYNDAKPVFADIEADTLCLDIEDVKEKITPKTRAIIPVHYGGHPCDMDPLMELAADHGIKVLEDAAHATGAEYKGCKIGSIGNAGSFSFQAIKNMTTGEGGMITTDDAKMDARLRKLRWVGINKDTISRSMAQYSWYYEVDELGYKCHLSDIQAAIGLVQLQKLDSHLNSGRDRVAQSYDQAFEGLPWLRRPVEHEWAKRVYWNYVIQLDERDRLGEVLNENGISFGVHYMPNHMHPFYQKLIRDGAIDEPRVPVTMEVWKRILTLPIFAGLAESEVELIIDTIREFAP